MATKYLTLRAELVETGKRECDKCVFGVYTEIYDGWSIHFDCGIENHPKFSEEHCKTGYWKEIDLTK